MRSSGTITCFALSCLVSLVVAHFEHSPHIRHPRQVLPPPVIPSASSSSSSTVSSYPAVSLVATLAPTTSAVQPTTTSVPPPPIPGSSSPVVTIPSGPTLISTISTPPTTYLFTLSATNPTAVPLSGIVSNEPSAATSPLGTTYTPGSLPTFLPNAPPLPNAALLSPSNYPALDITPPLDSPEVQQWIQEVANSGVSIPNISPTYLGGCSNNTAAASDPTRCWWTCGGCTRNTDVTDCPVVRDWGLTYDDGPAFYTSQLLNYLDEHNLKSTFFVVGSRVISFPNTLQAEYMKQHQIAIHTWSHSSLTTLSNNQIIAELGWSKKVIRDVLGVTPNMMRPPYGDIDDRVRAISLAMGLTPVMWTRISPLVTFDTGDFYIHGGLTSVQQVLYNWEGIVNSVASRNSGFIVLEHDLFQQAVEVATGYILPDALARNFSIKPVITCLNKPLRDAYIETNDNKTNPPPTGSGAIVTLSSGAPGSVQATAGAGKGQNSAPVSSLNTGLGIASAIVASFGAAFLWA